MYISWRTLLCYRAYHTWTCPSCPMLPSSSATHTTPHCWCEATSTTMTSTPQHPSPLARTTSPFKDPRPAPCTPGNTAQLWDEYERRAVENARRRETAWGTSRRQTQQSRFSSGTVLDIIKSYDPHSSPKISIRRASPHLDFGLPVHQDSRSSIADSTVATCKTCQKPITSTLGICQTCTKTIILSAPTTAVPALPPTASITLSHDELTPFPKHQPPSPPPAQKPTHSPSPLPIRLSSLPTPPPHPPSRPRKSSLPHLQISRKPITPQSPTTPPSISHSTRPTSLANITTPPYRHNSATSSELFQMWPYAETTSPSSVRASYQQRAVSAWEDSDSEDEEKGLVRYWRGRRWRGSRGSLGEGRRESKGEEGGSGEGRRKKGVWARVLSCGCDGEG